jgi:membrane-associated phospholipid phosphatase
MAATTGVLRVLCREHFPTDVMVGAVAGMGIGFLVPWLHELPENERRSAATQKQTVQIRPWLWGPSIGISGSFG